MSGEPPSSPDSGFTLTELLVALAVSAIVLGLAASAIRSATHVSKAAALFERVSALGAARHALAECIGAALPVSTIDSDGRIRMAFSGAADRLEAVCSTGPLSRVVLHTRQAGSARNVVLDAAPFARRTGVVEASEHLLVEDVLGLSIRYFGSEPDGRGEQWRDAWTGASGRFPRLVGIRVQLRDGDLRRWPELVVALRAVPQ